MELAWYLRNKIDSHTAFIHRQDTLDFVLDNIKPGERVLEIGPAEGYLSRRIIEKARCLVGVEIDKGYFKKLETIRNDRMRFINEDIEKAKLKEVFDSAILIHTLEHIKDPKGLLERLGSCAKKIIIESPCQTNWWLESLSRELNIPAWGDEKHFFLFNYRKIKEMLEESGWRIAFVQEHMKVLRVVALSTKLT